jgi:hypothetical protein
MRTPEHFSATPAPTFALDVRVRGPYAQVAPRFRGDPAAFLPPTTMHGQHEFRFPLWRSHVPSVLLLHAPWVRRLRISRWMTLDLSPSELSGLVGPLSGELVLIRTRRGGARLAFHGGYHANRGARPRSARRALLSRLIAWTFVRSVAVRLAGPQPTVPPSTELQGSQRA